MMQNKVITISSTGNKYYFGEDGTAQTGMFTGADGNAYYADSEGVLKAGTFFTYGGNTYYAQANGTLLRNIKKTISGKQYIFDANGHVKKWLFTWGGKTYYANGNGQLATSKFVTMSNTGYKYYFGSDGAAKSGFFTVGSNEYFGFPSGIIRKYLFKEGGFTYYANGEGVLTKSKMLTIKGNKYNFNKYGCASMGVFKAVNGNYYYANGNGVIRTSPGRIRFKGNLYIAKTGGILYRNQFVVTKDCAYYADEYARIKTSKFTYKDAFNNMELTPNSEGQIPLSQYKKLNMTGAPPAISMSPYVLIDIGDQKIYLYKGGKCILSSSIVSGRIYGKKYHGTPPGTYHLLYKQRDRYLEGFEDDGVTRYARRAVENGVRWQDLSVSRLARLCQSAE